MQEQAGAFTVQLTPKELAIVVLFASIGAAYASDDQEYLDDALHLLYVSGDAEPLWDSALTKMEMASGMLPTTGMIS